MHFESEEDRPKRYHLIGIGGIGMSGIARLLLEQNQTVSGSDIAAAPVLEELSRMGASICKKQTAENIFPGMTVVFSSDIKETNEEYQTAVLLKCPMRHRAELLAALMQGFESIVVTGTHGKTTTSSLMAWVLHTAKWDPGFCVGGIMHPFQSNARTGKGKYFVAEADESDGSFLLYHPSAAIVTNIDLDHMNFYKTEENLVAAFKKFIESCACRDLLFWCGDDARLRHLNPPGASYGFSKDCTIQCSGFQQEGWISRFDITVEGTRYSRIESCLAGAHNVLNATAVFGLSLRLGIPEEAIRDAFRTFEGVGRRCEKKSAGESILFLDDYAHHPTEIEATLNAIRAALPQKRLIAVFQPHRYTRTQSCLGLYGPIFQAVNALIITDIYSAGEAPIEGVSPDRLMQEVQTCAHPSVRYVCRQDLAEEMRKTIQPDDVVITLGAGDITYLIQEVAAKFQ